jgi:hypothetical protein
VIILEALVIAFAHHAQASSHGSFANCQNRANQQGLSIFPDGPGKQRLKLYDEGQQFGG